MAWILLFSFLVSGDSTRDNGFAVNCCALPVATVLLLLSSAAPQPAISDFYARGKADLDSKNYLKAERELEQAEHQSPGTTNALALRSKALINLARYEDAERCLRQYLKFSPHSADGTYLLAYVLFRRDKPRESLALYTEAAKLQRPTAEDFKIVGLDYVLLNDNEDALKWLERSVAEGPNNPEAVYFLGRAYYVENSFDKALAAFESALRLDPGNVKAENGMGLVFAAENRADLAEAAYRKAIRMEQQSGTSNQEPYLNLADLLSRGGHDPEVLHLLDSAERIGGKSDRSLEVRGRVFFAENRLSEAESELRAALVLKPKNGSLHYLLGRVLKREGKAEDAEKEFAQTRALLGPQAARSN
jgi:tetratricopeptide (TPR) repeat protein